RTVTGVQTCALPICYLLRSKVDGTERLQLTSAPIAAMWPRWSPDGSEIAFAAQLPGKPFHIYSISRDGGAPRELTNGSRDETFRSEERRVGKGRKIS